MDRKVRVAIKGYGVIGKRVADAVGLQADMTLISVADIARLAHPISPGERRSAVRRHD